MAAIDNLTEISINDFEGVCIGQAENAQAGTGCTVVMCKDGMTAGLDVRGGGPASRDSGLLAPLTSARYIHAVLLAGGSAFGLDATGGVMQYLEERGIGYDTGTAKVPLVCQSDIFDLGIGDASVRPDRAMAYEACMNAESGNFRSGNYGVGCGATVGKWAGIRYCMKSGIGSCAVLAGGLKVGAIAAVNAFGDIYDWRTGIQIAGLLSEDRRSLRNTREQMYRSCEIIDNKFTGNTTLGVIITNGKFRKTQLCKIAGMAHNGYARAINPVHTTADGDSIYALSSGNMDADMDMVGTLAADLMAEAIRRAVISAESAYGVPASRDIVK